MNVHHNSISRCKLRLYKQMWVKRRRGMVIAFDHSDETTARGGEISASSRTRIMSVTFTTMSIDALGRSILVW